MSDKLNFMWGWYKAFATLIGLPIAFVLLLVFFQKCFFTVTCQFGSFRCEHGFAFEESQVDVIGKLLAGDKNREVLVKKGT
ncbi:hypothetical protein EKK58_02125 [Candidatus Dependentiae bacterium]|nr:MAG: hypothetical protein EKK58_02125 [Candidatus Dependentiae bacterium]